MKQLLTWGAIEVNRRTFLRRTTAAIFGTLAGLATGVPTARADPVCVGYQGASSCGSCLCSGKNCVSGCGALCGHTAAYCGTPNGCWQSFGAWCCDCVCRSGTFGWNCWCYGS